jgi:hypothetical protein
MLGLMFILLATLHSQKMMTVEDTLYSDNELLIEPPVVQIETLKVSNKLKQITSLDEKYIEWSSFNLTASSDGVVILNTTTYLELYVSIDFQEERTIFRFSSLNV